MPGDLGLYLSIPFCRAKCTFCNFASDSFAGALLPRYLDVLQREIRSARAGADRLGAGLPDRVDTVYFGGGTPSLLDPRQIGEVFQALGEMFHIAVDAEITVECAPGQLSEGSLAAFLEAGVNRVSLGAQSFDDAELRAVGRTHRATECLAEIARVRRAGIERISADLIAGLPGQTERSWRASLGALLGSGVGHASVYMLEVDEGSRLGREVLAGGTRYGTGNLPDEDTCVAFYDEACSALEHAGLRQYEISNFAREGQRSAHNLKYWRRQPYLGFGLEAHSMLSVADGSAVRFSNTESLDTYLAESVPDAKLCPVFSILEENTAQPEPVTALQAIEETLFLGLRLNEGLQLGVLESAFGPEPLARLTPAFWLAEQDGLLHRAPANGAQSLESISLTQRGRALSNEVFARLIEALDEPKPVPRPATEMAIA